MKNSLDQIIAKFETSDLTGIIVNIKKFYIIHIIRNWIIYKLLNILNYF